jgi:DNA polymerase elongation subunit (family B)
MDEIDKILKELSEEVDEYKYRGKGLIQVKMEESKLVENYKSINLDYMSLYPQFMKTFNIKPDYNINIKRKEKIDKMRNPNQI